MTPSPRPAIVLDTNVVLDWLLFADPSSIALSAAIRRRQVRWIATPAMRDELADVLTRGLAASRGADTAGVLAGWDAHVDTVSESDRPPTQAALACSDPDDQKFIDLAVAAGATWLLSRDRAVLRLARQAARWHLQVMVPESWSAPT